MSATDFDGPAFPCEWDYIGSNRSSANGMTLRDYFAAKAMQAAMSSAANLGRASPQERAMVFDRMALVCYEVAAAMVKARTE
jgi:hypothetical protein